MLPELHWRRHGQPMQRNQSYPASTCLPGQYRSLVLGRVAKWTIFVWNRLRVWQIRHIHLYPKPPFVNPPPPSPLGPICKERKKDVEKKKKLKRRETVRWLLRNMARYYLQSSMSLSSIFIISTATLDMYSLSFWLAILASWTFCMSFS